MGKEIHGLHPQMPFCAAARPAIATKLDDLFTHEEGTRAGDDIEHLHDMRVASRRLRAAMDIFAPCFPRRVYKPLQKSAAALTKALGAVRDRDVLLEGLEHYAAGVPGDERIGICDLIQTVHDERTAYRQRMLEVLDDVDRTGFRHRLHALLAAEPSGSSRSRARGTLKPDASLREHAQRISVIRVADLYGFAPYVHDPARMKELHEMRIAAKHLRYSLEIFQICFAGDVEDRIDDVKNIQEQIGQIHDCDVLIEVLRRHLSVVAQRAQEELAALVAEPLPHDERMSHARAAIQAQEAADPRLGLLGLLSHKLDERNKRYEDFVRWWDKQERKNMREKLYTCITADLDQQDSQ